MIIDYFKFMILMNFLISIWVNGMIIIVLQFDIGDVNLGVGVIIGVDLLNFSSVIMSFIMVGSVIYGVVNNSLLLIFIVMLVNGGLSFSVVEGVNVGMLVILGFVLYEFNFLISYVIFVVVVFEL